MRALRAGAAGYLLKTSIRTELIETIRSVHGGGKRLDASVASAIALHAVEDALTDREAEVLSLAADGNSNRRIGSILGVSEDTVKGYMKIIFAKLSATDRTHAVTIAAKRGIIEL
jgi:DNA-binding NarL/FixJ family response regulator